jgi:hypothetical protein
VRFWTLWNFMLGPGFVPTQLLTADHFQTEPLQVLLCYFTARLNYK